MLKLTLLCLATVAAPIGFAQDLPDKVANSESEVIASSGDAVSEQSAQVVKAVEKLSTIKMCARIRTNDDGGFNGNVTIEASRLITLRCDGATVQQSNVTGLETVLLRMGSGASKNVCAVGALDLDAYKKILDEGCQVTIHGGPVKTEVRGINHSYMTATSIDTKLSM